MVTIMHLLSRAAVCCLAALSLAGCNAETRRYWRTAAPIISAIVDPAPTAKPRKARRPVTKD